MPFDFTEVFRRERDVINFRRRAIQDGRVARARAGLLPDAPKQGKDAPPPPEKGFAVPRTEAGLASDGIGGAERETIRTTAGSNLTGLALSGGGMRSASFCLGVLQALDALSEHDEPQILDALDYISAASGGGYIGTSLVAGLLQSNGSFPFDTRLDEQETPEIQHLRDFSNFLAPNGMADYLVSIALVARGLLVNAVIVLPALLILAALTIASNPLIDDLRTPDFFGIHLATGRIFPLVIPGLEAFTIAVNLAIVAAVLMFASAIFTSLTFRTSTLRSRENLGWALGWLLVIVLTAAFFEAQPFVIAGMLSAAPATAASEAASGPAQDILTGLGGIIPSLAAVLVPAAIALVTVAQKLGKLAKAAVGEATWSATLKKYGSKAILYLAALIVPLLLWVTYIYLCYWGIRAAMADGCGPATPFWLRAVSFCASAPQPSYVIGWLGPIGTFYLAVAAAVIIVCLFIGPNSNSLHRLYRDRLSRAFLFERADMGARDAPSTVDSWKFSSLKPRTPDGDNWMLAAAYAPYLLINTAINLAGSKELNKRGRNADTFMFSPLCVGSRFTRYVPTKEMEATVRDLSLASAMAISGAAASANMGRRTIKVLTFSLTLLNIRLGYWLANPYRLELFSHWFRRWQANVGTWYFAAETLGMINEKRLNVYLTDGGHIENLGIYELLRRRCKVILAVDAETDPDMTFPSLVNLEVMARIDLGVRIELQWQALQTSAVGVTASALYGPKGAPGAHGPHAAIGTIKYSDEETGILIYIKASLSGDENDYVLDYKRRNPTFPHESTVDQFFSEEQFEAYRALGFHAARGLLTGADDFATPIAPPAGWKAEVEAALALLNVPPSMIAKVMAHI
jgi:Patatin-like phospholipase